MVVVVVVVFNFIPGLVMKSSVFIGLSPNKENYKREELLMAHMSQSCL